MAALGRAVAVLTILALGACGARDNPARADAEPTAQSAAALDPAALKVVTDDVSGGLNAVPQQLHGLLERAAQLGAFRIEQFALSTDVEPIPFDGWLAERGFLTYVGEDYGQVYGRVTEAAFAVAILDDAVWLQAGPGRPEGVQCRAGETLNDAVCRFSVTYSVAPTDAGRLALGAIAPFPIRITAEARRSASGWSVDTIGGSERSLPAQVIDQLIGPADQRGARRDAALAKWRAAAVAAAPDVEAVDPEPQ